MQTITKVTMKDPGPAGIEYILSLALVLDSLNPGVARFRVTVNEKVHTYKTLGPAMTKFNSEVGLLVLAGAAVVGDVYKETPVTAQGGQS